MKALKNSFKRIRKEHGNLLFTFMILLALLLRIYDLGKMNLFPDEAYYWDWSRHLSFGYYSHPPIVSWVIYIGRNLVGQSEAALRLPFALIGTLTVVAIYKLAKEMFGKKAALLSTAAVATSPIFVLSSRLALPDAIVVLFWVLSTLFFWKAYKGNKKWDYYLFGVSLGLALLSKYVSFFLLITITVFILFANRWYKIKNRKNFGAGLLLAIFIFSPNLIWNLLHHWTTYIFPYLNETKLSFPHGVSAGLLIGNVLSWFNDQLASLDLITILSVICALPTFIYYGIVKKNDSVKFCFFTFFPITLFFSMFSGLKHWAFPGFFGAYLLLIYLFMQHLKNKKILYLFVSVIFIINAWLSIFIINSIAANNLDPKITNSTYVYIYRFTHLAKANIEAISFKINYQVEKQTIIAQDYTLASELAYYLPGHPRVYSPNGQYLLWGQPNDWRKVAVIAFDLPFFKSVTPQQIQTPSRIFYYYVYKDRKADLTKDWSLHFDWP